MTGKRRPFIEPTRSTASVPSALQELRVAKQGDGDSSIGAVDATVSVLPSRKSEGARVYAKLIALALARGHAMGQLAIVLTLNRLVPMIIAMRLRERGATLEQMEDRMLTMTLILVKSRGSAGSERNGHSGQISVGGLNRSPMRVRVSPGTPSETRSYWLTVKR